MNTTEIIVKNGTENIRRVEISIDKRKYIFIDKAARLMAHLINKKESSLKVFIDNLRTSQNK